MAVTLILCTLKQAQNDLKNWVLIKKKQIPLFLPTSKATSEIALKVSQYTFFIWCHGARSSARDSKCTDL